MFLRDSAPAHKAKSTQEWFRRQNIELIKPEEWPSSSPDLNPLDYKIWSFLEDIVCARPHKNLEHLKSALVKAVDEIDMNVVRAAIDDWPQRLRACVRQEETILNKYCIKFIVTYSCLYFNKKFSLFNTYYFFIVF